MALYFLNNECIHSHWGCTESMTRLFGYSNPESKPMAELWMGAHPSASSSIDVDGEKVLLKDIISSQPELYLGADASACFEERLPYLFKVLSARTPLSIQCHPDKTQAIEGWKRENQLNIPLNAPHRTYKDNNHKPELVYALTPYKALNGFRPIAEIVSLWQGLKLTDSGLSQQLDKLMALNSSAGLEAFYQYLMTMREPAAFVHKVVESCIVALDSTALTSTQKEAYQLLLLLNEYYEDDIGVLSGLLLNYVVLKPGEAMFLKARTLHAYLSGTALELMANSDNVIRGGLTPKFVNIEELMQTVSFEPLHSEQIKFPSAVSGPFEAYQVPARDFKLTIASIGLEVVEYCSSQADILFVIEGSVQVIVSVEETLTLQLGESCFVPACTNQYQLQGAGKVAIASCGL
tara:strand:+ start:40012 stop:41229 length:1218 start_codon:yes stop_codon:yes gene_type:complete